MLENRDRGTTAEKPLPMKGELEAMAKGIDNHLEVIEHLRGRLDPVLSSGNPEAKTAGEVKGTGGNSAIVRTLEDFNEQISKATRLLEDALNRLQI